MRAKKWDALLDRVCIVWTFRILEWTTVLTKRKAVVVKGHKLSESETGMYVTSVGAIWEDWIGWMIGSKDGSEVVFDTNLVDSTKSLLEERIYWITTSQWIEED